MSTGDFLKIVFPHPPGAGGPGSFQSRFENQLKVKGHAVCYKGSKIRPDLVFVVGGTRNLIWLAWMRLRGIPVLYRLDGIGWLHKKRKTSLKYYCTAECRNALSKAIHGFLASKIVYQSQFVKDWWDKSGWRKRKHTSIIHNGVTIPEQSEIEQVLQETQSKRLVVLEGVIDYTPYAVDLLNELAEKLPQDIQIELYGKFEQHNAKERLHKRLIYKGFVNREEVYTVFMGSVYLSLDIHPACPNTVAEALACGAPVVAFDTGSLSELVDDTCGKIVNYGSDPWELAYPDVKSLRTAIIDVFQDYEEYSKNAYHKAKTDYGIMEMITNYLHVIQN